MFVYVPPRCRFTVLLYTVAFISHVHARIRPNDDELTVYPNACDTNSDANGNRQRNGFVQVDTSGNCGILRLDAEENSWLLSSKDGVYTNIPSTLPGDILTDLQEAGIISDPYYNNNFLDQRHVWMGEDRAKSTGTSCYSSQPQRHHAKNDGRRRRINDEYRIPNLERRTRTWIYETHFRLNFPKEAALQSVSRNRWTSELNEQMEGNKHKLGRNKQYALVVEGIKMGASVWINDVHLGNVTDQFLRYIFPLPHSILRSDVSVFNPNSLSIVFDPEIDTHGRFMACSGGWDWAPYSKAAEASCSSRRVLSFGIFKPIYIVEMNDVAITNVVAKVRYMGDSTVEYLKDGYDFELVVEVHLLCQDIDGTSNDACLDAIDDSETGTVVMRTSFLPDIIVRIKDAQKRRDKSKSAGSTIIISFSKRIPQDDVSLWWPHGTGNQTLYTLQVAYQDGLYSTSWVQRKIGFRSVALITYNEHDKTPVNEGTGTHGFYFKINGVIIFARGANIIPSSQLEGRLTNDNHRILVESAVAANMNMLRVWGGGMVLPDSFYDACNEKGLLLYHDLMFVEEQYHGLVNKPEIEYEIRQIIRHLSSHPSIILWNGCNECDHTNSTTDLYSEFAMPIVAEEDGTRPIWGSSPSNGWESGVVARDQLPSGKHFRFREVSNVNESNIEVHGPYNHGATVNKVPETFGTVNGRFGINNETIFYDTKIPLIIRSHKIGAHYKNQFISEFGASVFSSFESMSAVLSTDNWGLHGNTIMPSNCSTIFENANECSGSNVLSQRNYPCDSHVRAYFGEVDLVSTGRELFQEQLLQCLLSQMFWMKGEIERLRSTNSFGHLIWQLNENWPTGGWGLLEYGSRWHEEGQVMGGRWKPLMHLLQRSLFRDVFATCGVAIDGSTFGKCFVRNDGIHPIQTRVDIEIWNFGNVTNAVVSREFSLDSHGGTEYFQVEIEEESLNSSALVIHIFQSETAHTLMGQNIILWKPPKDLHSLKRDPRLQILSITPAKDGTVVIMLRTESTVLYLGLTSSHQGIFEDNWFAMKAGTTKSISFRPLIRDEEKPLDIASFNDSLRIDHLGMVL